MHLRGRFLYVMNVYTDTFIFTIIAAVYHCIQNTWWLNIAQFSMKTDYVCNSILQIRRYLRFHPKIGFPINHANSFPWWNNSYLNVFGLKKKNYAFYTNSVEKTFSLCVFWVCTLYSVCAICALHSTHRCFWYAQCIFVCGAYVRHSKLDGLSEGCGVWLCWCACSWYYSNLQQMRAQKIPSVTI